MFFEWVDEIILFWFYEMFFCGVWYKMDYFWIVLKDIKYFDCKVGCYVKYYLYWVVDCEVLMFIFWYENNSIGCLIIFL